MACLYEAQVELGYVYGNAPDIASGGEACEQEEHRRVVLARKLRDLFLPNLLKHPASVTALTSSEGVFSSWLHHS